MFGLSLVHARVACGHEERLVRATRGYQVMEHAHPAIALHLVGRHQTQQARVVVVDDEEGHAVLMKR